MMRLCVKTLRASSKNLGVLRKGFSDISVTPARPTFTELEWDDINKPKYPKKNARIKVFRELLGPKISVYAATRDLDTLDAQCSSPHATPDGKQMEKMILMLRKLGFPKEDIRKDFALLSKDSLTINDTIQSLQELGVEHIKTSHVLKYLSTLSQVLQVAKAHFDLPPDFNLGHSLIKHLDCLPEASLCELRESLKQIDELRFTLGDLKALIYQHYFKWKFECSQEEAKQIVDKRSEILRRSYLHVDKIANSLRQSGFTPDQIMRVKKLFYYDPKVLETYCRTVSKVGSMVLPEFLAKYPRVLEVGPDVVLPNLIALRCYGFSEQAIENCVPALYLDPSVLRTRLMEVEHIPEFSILRTHSRFLSVLLYYNRASARLQDARLSHPHKISVQLLTSRNDVYSQAITHIKTFRLSDQLLEYLSDLLGEDQRLIRARLGEHPHRNHLELVHVKTVVDFLVDERFTTEQISRGIQLVLYPKLVIEQHILKVVLLPELQPFTKWRKHPQLLQILLYLIERNFHFTGNGIFSEPEPEVQDHQHQKRDKSDTF